MPRHSLNLNWTWELDHNATKLLGIPVAQQVSVKRMTELLEDKLEVNLKNSKKNPASLIARVTIVIHLIDASLWFLLTLWPGDMKTLEQMQNKVTKFVWAAKKSKARHRISFSTICRPKREGGLGLISIPAQTRALSGRFIIWALQETEENHPLRMLIRHYLE
jgi:hypothetical protein